MEHHSSEHPERSGEMPGRPVPVVRPQIVELIDPAEAENFEPERFRPLRPVSRPVRSRKKLALFLFLATCLSTFLAGGPVYAVAVMLILTAHEMGHYLQSRRYHVPASLPYFIPMPFTPLGTMGAVIVQGGHVADRKQLFDIAITGPLAGLVLALPISWFGLLQSHIAPLSPNYNGFVFGDPLIFRWMAELIHGPIGPNEQIVTPPLAFAGWVGIFVTALNLIPIGQLDGGHILYALIRRRAHWVARGLLLGAVGYMISTGDYSYSLMVILLFLIGPSHPPTRDDTVPLGRFRIILGWLTLAFIVIGFTPRPIIQMP